MKARVIRPQELDAGALARWRTMIDGAPLYRNPFYAPEFTRAVADARQDAYVAVIEDAGETVGFFPFHKLRGGVAKPIGGPISDYQGPIFAAGFAPDPQGLLKACGLASYDFNHLPLAMQNFADLSYARSRSPHVDLSDGYETYANGQSKSWRSAMKAMRRRWRKTEREIGPIRFTYHDAADDIYDRHKGMKNKLYEKLGVRSVLDAPWVAAVLDSIRKTQTPEFAGVMTTVHAGEKLMAAHFGMRSRTVWHWWFSSYDLETANYGSGIILIHEALRCANDHGLDIIDFGRGEAEYKTTFSNGATPLCEGSAERAGTLPGALRTGQKALLSVARPLPLGKYESYPRRALARLISGMRLPALSD